MYLYYFLCQKQPAYKVNWGGGWPGELTVVSVATWHADRTSTKIMDFNCGQKEKYDFLIEEKWSQQCKQEKISHLLQQEFSQKLQ
jgi:hypothetical protein